MAAKVFAVCLCVAFAAAQDNVMARDESADFYENMRLFVLYPGPGNVVYHRKVGVYVGAMAPAFESTTFANRRDWDVFFNITNGGYLRTFSGRLPRLAHLLQPYDLDFMIQSRGSLALVPGPVEAAMTIRHFPQTLDDPYLESVVRTSFDYQPEVTMPDLIPLIGSGRGLSLVTPDMPIPTTRKNTVFRLGVMCYFARGEAACNTTTFSQFIKDFYATHGSLDDGCKRPAFIDAYATNDATRLQHRMVAAEFGEIPADEGQPSGPLNVPHVYNWLQEVQYGGDVAISPDGTVSYNKKCVPEAAMPRLAREVAAGKALRDRILQQSGLAINAADGALFPKPLPPLPSRLELGALLTSENKRIGLEIGVQNGVFLETLLLTWTTCEVLFGLDPWEVQENYVDFANAKDQDDAFTVRFGAFGSR